MAYSIYTTSLMKKLFTLLLISSLIFFVKSASAAVRCETQYGGTQVCVTTGQLQINKEILDPISKRYVDNLGINDYKFAPGELVTFRISIKNVGDANFSKVSVSDSPQSEFLSLAAGSLNFDLTDLKPGETRTRELQLRIADGSKLPQNNTICVINAAEAAADNSKDRDTTQLCLERKVAVPVTKALPPTGAQDWVYLFGSLSGLAAGVRLTKFGKIKEVAQSYFDMTENRLINKGRG